VSVAAAAAAASLRDPGRVAAGWPLSAAEPLAMVLLHAMPDRLAHSLMAGRQARRLASAVPAEERELLVAAATLHDIGYAAAVRQTGFHPIDGARFLRATGAPDRLACLVAHHSEAQLLAAAKGLLPALAEFPRECSELSDALDYADLTTGPTGTLMSVPDRLADIGRRHADEAPPLRAARARRNPFLLEAAQRVRARLTAAGDGSAQTRASDGVAPRP
jgi:putative nucleotidyltransferase with HDIG domain